MHRETSFHVSLALLVSVTIAAAVSAPLRGEAGGGILRLARAGVRLGARNGR